MISIKAVIDLLKEHNQFLDEKMLDYEYKIDYLCDNSNDCRENSLLFCKGINFKESYLTDAIKKGISLYLTDCQSLFKYNQGIFVKDIKISISLISSLFYDYPQNKIKIIGITGTKGKTSTVYILKNIIDKYLEGTSKKCGVISSIENYDGKEHEVSHLSTPEPLQLIQKLSNMVNNGCEYCVMEVSSQALKYNRVHSIRFYLSCFTNIGEDHISDIEHVSFSDYFMSKLKIIEKSDKVLINSNIEVDYKDNIIFFDYLGFNTNAKYILKNLKSSIKKLTFDINGNNFCINMFGDFNAYNAFASISIALEIGISVDDIKIALKNINIPGRSELFENIKDDKIFIVDYAHNKLSYEALYESVKINYPKYNIITIFGCPGGKAITRRKDLPNIAEKYSNYIYITEEDFGNEPLDKICNEIYENINNKNIVEIEYNRENAISKAFQKYDGKTVILILGKGRENTQKRFNVYEEVLSDVDIVKKYVDN